jgi:phytoene synthase
MRNEDTAIRAVEPTADPVRRGAPPGSLRFYAVLFAPPERRTVLNALYALEAELRDCATSSNHDIAHTRLQWWREELDRFASGLARHPITVALSTVRERVTPGAALNELIIGAELDLIRFTYHTWSDLVAYCQRSSGALQSLIAAALVAPDAATDRELAFARELGVAVRQVEMLRDPQRDGHRGLIYAPLDVLASRRVTPEAWTAGHATPEPNAVLNEWTDRVSCSSTRPR